MKAWYCIPSARPAAEAQRWIDAWRDMGYGTAVWRDHEPGWMMRDSGSFSVSCDHAISGEYPGYAKAVNALSAYVMQLHPDCDWIVTGGDDVWPDSRKKADWIAEECSEHFFREAVVKSAGHSPSPAGMRKFWEDLVASGRRKENVETYGCMQPTGDRFAGGSIDRIAGSPWMGREWCLRANKGQGPLHPDFWHMFVDEFLQESAKSQGVFWQRPDLVHLHRHYQRESDALNAKAVAKPIPPHLVRANSQQHWNESKAIFTRHKADGFRAGLPL